jgi:hypothetical protein
MRCLVLPFTPQLWCCVECIATLPALLLCSALAALRSSGISHCCMPALQCAVFGVLGRSRRAGFRGLGTRQIPAGFMVYGVACVYVFLPMWVQACLMKGHVLLMCYFCVTQCTPSQGFREASQSMARRVCCCICVTLLVTCYIQTAPPQPASVVAAWVPFAAVVHDGNAAAAS